MQQYLPFTVLKLVDSFLVFREASKLQQYLPFTVLKPSLVVEYSPVTFIVATVLTVYGIETLIIKIITRHLVSVATVLTVYGIETVVPRGNLNTGSFLLQQYLPFTVLKLATIWHVSSSFICCNSTYRLRY